MKIESENPLKNQDKPPGTLTDALLMKRASESAEEGLLKALIDY